jgi:plastocyanin
VQSIKAAVTVVCVALLCGACGGSSPSSPSSSGGSGSNSGGGGGTAAGGTTITITSSGVSPKSLTVPAGTQVTFVNNDTSPHDMSSDPHPEHTTCPEINTVGFITPGQTRQTSALRTVRTCGFHDHNQPSNSSLAGSIVIQ